MSVYPSESHHLRDWIFESFDSLQKIREENNERAREHWRDVFRQISLENFDLEQLLLTPKEEETLVSYYGRQLIEFCNHKQLPFVSKYNASVLYRRFFTNQSVMSYDPRIIIFTSLSLALKLEEYGLHFTLEKLFGDVPGLNVHEVFRHELTVCNTLRFHLYILNPRNTLEGLRLLYKKYYIDVLVVSGSLDGLNNKDLDKKNQLIGLLAKVILKAETYILMISHTPCFLLYTPSQVSITLFDISARELNLPNSGEFLKKVLKEVHQTNMFNPEIDTDTSSLSTIHSIRELVIQTLETDRAAREGGYCHEEEETTRILDKLAKLHRRKNKEMKRRKKSSS
ncbi:cyclin H-like protein [Cryptosporidium canis]|uniref:Cyclin H-like protein n=1 Tax=Cryptosporidium canis TaxID=195482 RepID=A0ABQ8P8W3_9CRYT|nr:cyclin H-like protein [Cryptosporidium canis]KAJ1612790.1 cyclin H-like protein [Cryptosporidium canis]